MLSLKDLQTNTEQKQTLLYLVEMMCSDLPPDNAQSSSIDVGL